ncbi:MAG: sensor histidine kinase [Promethearchaeota archaeon]
MKKSFSDIYGGLLIHDFGTILQNIQSSLELSSGCLNKPEQIRKYWSIINKQVIRGNQLLSNVINLSKIDNSKNSLQHIDILKVLNKAIKFIEASYQEQNVNIEINNSIISNSFFNGVYILGDKLLQNVFENIIFNAIYHNRNQTIHILIKISREKLNNIHFIRLNFIDNGVGINDGRKKIIFQKGDVIQEGKKNMGFGLTLVKKLVKKYNGYIWVEDKVKGQHNKGSIFAIMLPELCENPYILTMRRE